jgi:glycosyltransferase involved in cell wall biosynthesis
MAIEKTSVNRDHTVWAIGPMPPPVNGMSLLTDKVVSRLLEKGPVTIADWSFGDASPRLHTRVLRAVRSAMCLAKLLWNGRAKDGRLYLTCNSKGGLIMTDMLIKAARRLGYRIYLHHHVYTYIDKYDSNMASCDRHMAPEDSHLMHCPQMVNDFRAKYKSHATFVPLFPSFASLPLGEPRERFREPFRLGHLSNLTLLKGLDLVIDTFRALRARNRNVQLFLAGPFVTAEAERLVARTVDEFKGAVVHVGPVYDQKKIEYARSVDCFLFPTRYDCEAWPIAVNEALDAALPVIATDRGCLRTLVGESAGRIVPESDYVNEAVKQIESWMDSPQSYRDSSLGALEHAKMLRRESEIQFERVIESICSPSKSDAVNAA